MDRSSSAWGLALEAAGRASVTIAPLREMRDAEEAASVVRAVWGDDILEPSLIRAFQHAGSVALAAAEEGRFVGFVLGFAGLDEGLHLHSHILGVLPERRSSGVGYALKLAQRAACLEAGIEEIRWTYDPLIARNGRFNLVKLGAVATRLLPGFYGEMRDEVNRGDRSDRFEVRWSLTSRRTELALGGEPPEPPEGPMMLWRGAAEEPAPQADVPAPAGGARVAVPLDFQALRHRDPVLGSRWRDLSAEAFSACFEAGLVAVWVSRDGVYTFEPKGPAR